MLHIYGKKSFYIFLSSLIFLSFPTMANRLNTEFASETRFNATGANTNKMNSKFAIIEFTQKPDQEQLKQIQNILGIKKSERLSYYNSDYFQKTYLVESKQNLDLNSWRQKFEHLSFIKNISLSFEVQQYNVIPSSSYNANAANSTLDTEFGHLQWALYNSGQSISYALDQNNSKWIESNYNKVAKEKVADIAWDIAAKQLQKMNLKETSIAIIDSGLDVEHPELKDKILKNLKHCGPNGLPLPGVQIPTAENPYPNDCLGWNFAAKTNLENAILNDYIGHGTHIAGIIAADTKNKLGINGISNNIKILPLKVYGNSGTRSDNISLTHLVTKAILYAIERKVDVINLSLGWPIYLETPDVKNAIQEAISKGIYVVAAAGNDNTSVPVSPCSYENVVCVGSISLDGQYSNFTNYGSHVDILAPGDSILSTFPSSLESIVFGARSYEYLTGTSQAAPHISASLALLKSLPQTANYWQNLAKLYQSSIQVDTKENNKFSQFGYFKLNKIFENKQSSLIVPVLKNLSSIAFSNTNIEFELPIQNYSYLAKNVDIQITSENPKLRIQNNYNIAELKSGEIKKLLIKAKILDEKINKDVFINIKITSKDWTKTFKHKLELVHQIHKHKNSLEWKIRLSKYPEAKSSFLSVSSIYSEDENASFFQMSKLKTSFIFDFFKADKNGVKKLGSFELPRAKEIRSVHQIDANYDGQLDYIIVSQIAGEQTSQDYLQYTYLNANLEPLFAKQADFKLEDGGALVSSQNNRSLRFYKKWDADLGFIALPVFQDMANLPTEDQYPNELSFDQLAPSLHFYYFDLKTIGQSKILYSRLLSNTNIINKIKKYFSLKQSQKIRFIHILQQTKTEFLNNIVKFMIQVENNESFRYAILSFDLNQALQNQFQARILPFANINLDFNLHYPSISLSGPYPEKKGDSFFVSYPYQARFVNILDTSNTEAIWKNEDAVQNDLEDKIIANANIFNFVSESSISQFFTTENHIQLIEKNSNSFKRFKIEMPKNSILPGEVAKGMIYPLTAFHNEGIYLPALFVDISLVSKRQVYTILKDREALVSPAVLNVQIPKNCDRLNPIRLEQSMYYYAFICAGQDSESLMFYPIRW